MRPLLGLLGRGTLMIASMAFVAAAGLFVLGSWLVTFPILRLSPRDRKMHAGMQLAAALLGAAQAFGSDSPAIGAAIGAGIKGAASVAIEPEA